MFSKSIFYIVLFIFLVNVDYIYIQNRYLSTVTLSFVMLKTLLMDGVTNSALRIRIRSGVAQNGVMVSKFNLVKVQFLISDHSHSSTVRRSSSFSEEALQHVSAGPILLI